MSPLHVLYCQISTCLINWSILKRYWKVDIKRKAITFFICIYLCDLLFLFMSVTIPFWKITFFPTLHSWQELNLCKAPIDLCHSTGYSIIITIISMLSVFLHTSAFHYKTFLIKDIFHNVSKSKNKKVR